MGMGDANEGRDGQGQRACLVHGVQERVRLNGTDDGAHKQAEDEELPRLSKLPRLSMFLKANLLENQEEPQHFCRR